MTTTFHIVTLFPEFFYSPFSLGIMGRAIRKGIINYTLHNPRDFSADRHKHVDDSPYGGGPGMVIGVPPLYSTIKSIANPGSILLLSPSGKKFDQDYAASLAGEQNITLICGRYEGIDARLKDFFPIEEISFGDAVLNGGETAAFAVIEAVSRLIPGFMGKDESASEESFANGLLEYPQYTRPAEFMGKPVPEILFSGHHGQIARWRRLKSLERTLSSRPDLLKEASLDAEDAKFLKHLPRLRFGKNISFCLMHHPVFLDDHKVGASSLTNLDIHDIARISRAYGMGPFYIFTPLRDQLELAHSIIDHWLGRSDEPDRAHALALARPYDDFGRMEADIRNYYGNDPLYLITSAKWPKRKKDPAPISPADARALALDHPLVICLGTARGLDERRLPFEYMRLRPLRFLDENHLSVRSAAAIMADRLLGDFN